MNGNVRTIKAAMRLILSLGVILVLGGCDLFGWRVHKAISVKYEESGFSALQTLSNGGSSIQGLYFGELEIVAYHYRPGETIQTGGFASGHGNTDWSHYVVVQSGHPAARDVVLFSNDAIDIDALNADYRQGVSKEYVDNVGEFSIDVFEVNLYRNGVIIDNVFYGNNAENNGLETHPLHRYAELNGIPDHYANTRIAGFSRPEQTHNVLFVRSDWFSDPVQVEMSTMGGDSGYEVASSSSPLIEFQEDLLISLAEGGTQRRFYSNFIIVPYGSVRSIDLSRDETITATVRFDFSDAIDYEPGRTDLAAIRDNDWATNPDNQLWFKTDANGVPLGLDVQFE